jgi:hypothetical protein
MIRNGRGKGEWNDQGLITSLDVGKGILNNRALEAVVRLYYSVGTCCAEAVQRLCKGGCVLKGAVHWLCADGLCSKRLCLTRLC